MLHIIDFFIKGFDSGRLQQNSNSSKIVILDKETNIFTHNDNILFHFLTKVIHFDIHTSESTVLFYQNTCKIKQFIKII